MPHTTKDNSGVTSLVAESIKSAMTVSVRAIDIDHDHANGENGHAPLQANGHHQPQVDKLTMATKPLTIPRTVQIARKVRKRIVCELDDVHDSYFQHLNRQSYFEYLDDQRLIHMPERGDQWDQVLQEAEHFGIQVISFADQLRGESHFACDVALGSCRLLLEVSTTLNIVL